ncbi:MAG: hypothetical protein QOI95_314 [Acidimicrobiaceae bacterium]|jgi:SAM-dependent methyltransferase
MPEDFVAWNDRWGAPFGRNFWWARDARKALTRVGLGQSDLAIRVGGPFCVQGNSNTREVEYPWAYFESRLEPGLEVVELGGALAGFQFVLSKQGCHVMNVDPGEEDQAYWELAIRLDDDTMARLNRLFRTDVVLVGSTLAQARLASNSVDRVISISTIEHILPSHLPDLGKEIGRVLRPGGLCVLTIDMFLDLQPFTDKLENPYGRNIDVRALVDATGLELVMGDRSELLGFDDCDPNGILRNLGEFYMGYGYPVCAQALVLAKP